MKKTFLKSILTLVALSAAAGAVFAQQDTPESAAKAYFAAMQAADWAKLTSLMHPEALASIKSIISDAVKADQSGDAAKAIFKLRSASEFSQLSDAAIFERLMDSIFSGAPEAKAALSSTTDTILGKVDEGPNLAHIVFRSRSKVDGEELNEVNLITFKKQGSAWRALLTADMEEIVNGLVEEMSPPPEEDKNAPPQGGGKPPRRP
jgi:hypothetical protein